MRVFDHMQIICTHIAQLFSAHPDPLAVRGGGEGEGEGEERGRG